MLAAKIGGSYNIKEWDGIVDRVVVVSLYPDNNIVAIRYPDGETQNMRLDVFESQIVAEV